MMTKKIFFSQRSTNNTNIDLLAAVTKAPRSCKQFSKTIFTTTPTQQMSQQDVPTTPDEAPEANSSVGQQDKVVILFKAVGNTPILKKSKAKISTSSQFREVIGFIRKMLKLKNDQSLVCRILYH